jgi:hypothetical protein
MHLTHPTRFAGRWLCVWRRLILPISVACFAIRGTAQIPGVTPTDTTKRSTETVTKGRPAVRDSAYIRDSIFYTNLKRRMEKRGLTRDLYNFLFRDVYNSRAQQDVKAIEENHFKPYEGRVIRSILVKRLEVFGPSVYDTLRRPGNWVERLGNRLHTDTREGIIKRSFLLFQEGQHVDSELLRNNERLLRSSNLFHDARIILIPEPKDPRVVDVLVLTQDVWSLIPDGGFGGFNNFQLNLEQRNFRGLTHSLLYGIRYDANAPYQKFEAQTIYKIPYIGKTFITGQGSLLYQQYQKVVELTAFRPFLTPETKWAGAATLSYNARRNRVIVGDRGDSTTVFPLNYTLADLWVGRAFKLDFLQGVSEEFKRRSRLILAVRSTAYHYTRRPVISLDTNQLYQNSTSLLFSIGFTNRDYKRDLLIYGFGRTEDVPVGYLAQLVIGPESAELGSRTYTALRFARGAYLPRRGGYLYTLTNIGGFLRPGKLEQGVINVEANYFSPLMSWGRSDFRHFLNFRYTAGFDRFNNEYLTINNQYGIIGVSSDALVGTKRLTFGAESVFFSPFNIIGFRVAIFGFASLGLVSSSNKKLFDGPLYQGYGLGFRLRNENLTFNTVQFRIGYYPNIPKLSNPLRFEFSGETPLRFNDFNFDRPEYRADGFLTTR